MKKMFFIKMFAVFAAMSVAMVPAMSASADTTGTTDSGTGEANGSVNINGTILPLTIAVTHQITINYTIDPNSGTISATPITVTNDTRVPVYVTAESVSSASGGDLDFTDVGPNNKDWTSLSTTDSKKYIALGVKIDDASGWNSGYYTGTDWSADKTPVTFGSLNAGVTGNLALTAKSGYAFDSQYTAKANIILIVSLV